MPPIGSLLAKAFSIGGGRAIDFSGPLGEISHVAGEATRSGMKVNPEGALRVAAVWIANTLIADEVSSLPMRIVKRDDVRRQPVRPSELPALWGRPNPDQTRMGFWGTTSLSLTLWGVSYTQLGWTNGGTLGQMWPVDPQRCSLERMDDLGLRLKVSGQGELENHPGERPQFMMISLYTLPGSMTPISPVRYAAELLGLNAAYEALAARMVGRGFNPSVVLTAGERIPPEAAAAMQAALEGTHSGPDKAGRVAVMGGKDLKLERLTMSAVDAQMVAQSERVFALAMALWRVPPTVAGMVDKPSTWGTGVEAFARGLERFTLRPIVERIQGAVEAYITEWVDPNLQARMKFDAMLSAAPKDRAEVQRLALANGMTSVERVLAQNDEPPFGEDETVFSQLAMAGEEDRRLQRLKQQAEAVAALIRAGFEPAGAVAAVGMEPIAHTGLLPITVKPATEGTVAAPEDVASPAKPAPEKAASRTVRKSITRDADGAITGVIEEEIP